MDALTPASAGRWLVTTRGSQHLFDLDAGTYQRMRGSGRGAFCYDELVVELTRIEVWPRVGGVFLIWFDDLGHPAALERWHRSSTISIIARRPDEPGC